VQSASRTSVWETGCHNWYTTASGRNTNNWPDHTFLYRRRVRRFDLAAYRAMPQHPPGADQPGAGQHSADQPSAGQPGAGQQGAGAA
jgi:hypothetical protein